MPTTLCRCCKGTGQTDQKKLGAAMKKLRLKANLNMKQISMAIGFSHSYVCELEKGNRNWSAELIEKYKAACE